MSENEVRTRFSSDSSGIVYVASRSFGRRPVSHSRICVCDLDGFIDEVYADGTDGDAGAANAAKDDDVSDAGDDALDYVERARRIVALLVFRQHRQFCSTNDH